MEKLTPRQGEAKAKTHNRLNFTLSNGVLNLIAPVDEIEVKEFDSEYSRLLDLLKI